MDTWRRSGDLRATADMATLMLAADPEFYALFGLSRAELIEATMAAMSDSASDVGQWAVLMRDGEPAGLYAAYPSNEMMARQMVGLKYLLAKVRDAKSIGPSLRGFASQKRAIAGAAYYLARIAVAPSWRGQHLGRAVLARFEAEARKQDLPATALHVRRGNASAERLYAEAGYTSAADDAGLPYAALGKPLI